ncbi:MAG TPA: hypothetical protein VHN15_07680 [Thermoanaerobaculia bacterium]|nr:hypothetical protein [Thermoanaerobaculia bacterium]
MVRGIKKAIAALKSDPSQPVTAEIDNLIVEMRVTRRVTADDIFREVGPWEGESGEEVMRRIREARDQGSLEIPQF